MLEIRILEMGAEGVWKVKLGDLTLPGYLKREVEGERWTITRNGRVMKTMPLTREAAACLLTYQHLQDERQEMIQVEIERQEAADERAAARKGTSE